MGKQLLGPVFFPLEEPRPVLQSLARSQGSKEAVRSIRQRIRSRSYSAASGAGEARWTEWEEELPCWLVPSFQLPGPHGPFLGRSPTLP